MDKIKADVAEKGDIGTVAEVRKSHKFYYLLDNEG